MPNLNRKQTSTLVKELCWRIQGELQANGRDDLIDGVYLMGDLLKQQPPATLKSMRPALLEILENDDLIAGVAKLLERANRQRKTVGEIIPKAHRKKRQS